MKVLISLAAPPHPYQCLVNTLTQSKMEAISLIGLASSIAQLVGAAVEIFSTCRELSNSAGRIPHEIGRLDDLANNVERLSERLDNAVISMRQQSSMADGNKIHKLAIQSKDITL